MMKFLRGLLGIKPKQMPLPGMQRDPSAGIVWPRPTRAPAMPPVAPPLAARRVSSFAMAPAPAPAVRSSDDSDLMTGILIHQMLTSSSAPSEPQACTVETPAPSYSSGGGGDFGGGGAESSWSSSDSSSADSSSSSSDSGSSSSSD